MSQLRALIARDAGAPLRRTYLGRDSVLSMASTGLCAGVEVYLLADDDLEALASSLPDGVIMNRGAKHPAKALSEYFVGKPGFVRLRAPYRQAGQTERGIRALLATMQKTRANARCFVGVPRDVIDSLWMRSADASDPLSAKDGQGRSSLDELEELLSLHPELDIPESVMKSYVGDAPVVRLVHFLIVLSANCDFPVLIEGESGTGKEIVARQIHALRAGVDGKCVCVNCGGIPTDLLESELFGHVQGAFTSATHNKIGLWKDADNGTLFLDEIGDLAPIHQVKVLRAIEEGTFLPVGGIKPIRSQARIVAATHRSLDALVQAGRFREDLYHRLAVLRIRTPSLREHAEDVPSLARHLWPLVRLAKDQILTDDICDLLQAQLFPGNVRELRSTLSELAMISYGKPITSRMARLVLRRRRSARDE